MLSKFTSNPKKSH